jgi:HNH endonuclease
MPKPIHYSAEQMSFIKNNCTLSRKELTTLVNYHFETKFKVDHIKSLCTRKNWVTGRDGRFEKGHIPAPSSGAKGPNKTSFKQGHKPHNWQAIGHERTTSDGYLQRKVTDTGSTVDDYVEVHRLLWEEHNGPIPEGHNIIFIDGIKRHIEIDNLEMVTRGELVVINKRRLLTTAPELRHAAITLGRLIHRRAQVSKNLNESKRDGVDR